MGIVEQVKGAIKEKAGDLVGNEELEAEGTAQKEKGEAESTATAEKVKGKAPEKEADALDAQAGDL